MESNSAANTEEKADMATNDSLDDVETPITPGTPQEEDSNFPIYRADVARGEWRPPRPKWKNNDHVYLRMNDNTQRGPFTITGRRAPRNDHEVWKYDIQNEKKVEKKGIPEDRLS